MICLFPKKFPKQNYLSNFLARFQPGFVQYYGYGNDITLYKDGPIAILKNKVAKGELMKDDHQLKVAGTLQGIYEEINGYKPEESGLINKWLGRKRRQPPKGLYLYGAVGGGKTMLMDLFYECCQVSRFAVPVSSAHGEPNFLLLVINLTFIIFFRIFFSNKGFTLYSKGNVIKKTLNL